MPGLAHSSNSRPKNDAVAVWISRSNAMCEVELNCRPFLDFVLIFSYSFLDFVDIDSERVMTTRRGIIIDIPLVESCDDAHKRTDNRTEPYVSVYRPWGNTWLLSDVRDSTSAPASHVARRDNRRRMHSIPGMVGRLMTIRFRSAAGTN